MHTAIKKLLNTVTVLKHMCNPSPFRLVSCLRSLSLMAHNKKLVICMTNKLCTCIHEINHAYKLQEKERLSEVIVGVINSITSLFLVQTLSLGDINVLLKHTNLWILGLWLSKVDSFPTI